MDHRHSDYQVPHMLNVKFKKAIDRSSILHEFEYQAVKKQHTQRVYVAKVNI